MGKILTVERSSFWTGFRFSLNSGDGEEHKGCSATIALLGYYVNIKLPPILRPHRLKVFPSSWDAATVARLGRNWYWDYTERQYGFYISGGFFNVMFGRQSNDSVDEQRWGCFIPWQQWRFVRESLYGLKGELVWTQMEKDRKPRDFEIRHAAVEACPKVYFAFKDFDSEMICAATHIEEREWHRGSGWFKWLSVFYPRKIRRDLSIEFSKETGRRKGSWKGGTMGHSIDLATPDELHGAAFRRYCGEHEMLFLRELKEAEYIKLLPPKPERQPDSGQCAVEKPA